MKPLQLLATCNIISRKSRRVQQNFSVWVALHNFSYNKEVTLHWAGEDGVWHQQKMHYVTVLGDGRELWDGGWTQTLSAESALAGNVRYALEYRAEENRYSEEGFFIEADAGYALPSGERIFSADYAPHLSPEQKSLNITAVVGREWQPQRVFVRWSTDQWLTHHETACETQLDYWDKSLQSNARNPNQYGCTVWTARLPIAHAYRIDYVIGVESAEKVHWHNNSGRNFTARHAPLKILTLNLHTYQESDQQTKFTRIAQAIRELDIDLICLQEVGEQWNNGQGDWQSNAARIIAEQIGTPYHLHTDWSHRGFETYREGIAILSRYPFRWVDSSFVSADTSPYNIHSRKIVAAQPIIPTLGPINLFSCHLSWIDEGFIHQFTKLQSWAEHLHTPPTIATLLCGDFNIKAGGIGYQHVVENSPFEDQHLKLSNRLLFDQIYHHPHPKWPTLLTDDDRIDYIFLHHDSKLKAVRSRALFTDNDPYGTVSDHCGYLVEFELL